MPEFLSLTVTVRYDFSPIFTGFFVNVNSTKNCFDTCELSHSPTIPSNNEENLPPAISFVILQKLSPSVAIPSSPSKAVLYHLQKCRCLPAALTFNGKTKNDVNNNNEKPINVQSVDKWLRDFILFIFNYYSSQITF